MLRITIGLLESTVHKCESILKMCNANEFARAFDRVRQRGYSRFCQLALGNVTLDGHKMRRGSVRVADGGNLPFQIEFRSVFSVIDGLTEERLAACEGLPKPPQHG